MLNTALCYYVLPASWEINSAALTTTQWLNNKVSYLHCTVADHSPITSLLRFLCLRLFCRLLLALLCWIQPSYTLHFTCYVHISLWYEIHKKINQSRQSQTQISKVKGSFCMHLFKQVKIKSNYVFLGIIEVTNK